MTTCCMMCYRSIKMSSPMLNNVIICGCILMYSEVFVNSIDNMSPNESEIGGLICMVCTYISLYTGTQQFLFTSIYISIFKRIHSNEVLRAYYQCKIRVILSNCWPIHKALSIQLYQKDTNPKPEIMHSLTLTQVWTGTHTHTVNVHTKFH